MSRGGSSCSCRPIPPSWVRPRRVSGHAALSIVNDAVRLRRGTLRPEFGAEMAYLMTGVLLTTADR